MSQTLFDAVEDPPVEEVRRMDCVAGSSQLVCERDKTWGLTLRVVKQQHFSHI
jgi:hypothetical protein